MLEIHLPALLLPDLLGCATGTNPVKCALTVFSGKFPFDILRAMPPEGLSCPRLNFFANEFDVCFLYQAIAVMRYPMVVGLLIKIYIRL
jgi:hypothetical protein